MAFSDPGAPIISSFQFDNEQLQDIIDKKKKKKDGKKKDKENMTKNDVTAIMNEYESSEGKASNAQLASKSDLSLGQTIKIRKELDYITEKYSAQ